MRPRIRLSAALLSIARFGLLSATLVAGTATASAQQRTLCVHDVPADQALRVRSGPGTGATVIGEFSAGACGVRLVGRCEGDWCQMALGTKSGWVDTRHIGIYEVPAGTADRAPAAGERTTATAPAGLLQWPASPPPSPPPAGSATRYGLAGPAPTPRHRQVEDGSRRSDPGSCVARVERWDTLRIRSGPGTGHDEIGRIPAGACHVERAGGCRGDWCRVAWRGRSGWVNTFYLD